MDKATNGTTVLQSPGTVTMEKALTKRIGDNYVKVTVGISIPIEEASADKVAYIETKKKITRSIQRLNILIDEEMDEQFANL